MIYCCFHLFLFYTFNISEANFVESIFSLYHVCFWDQTRVIRTWQQALLPTEPPCWPHYMLAPLHALKIYLHNFNTHQHFLKLMHQHMNNQVAARVPMRYFHPLANI